MPTLTPDADCRAQVEELRAALAEERRLRAYSEGLAEGLRQALATAFAGRPAVPAPTAAPVTQPSVTSRKRSVTASVTQEGEKAGEAEKAERIRAGNAARQAVKRQRDGLRDVTQPSVTQLQVSPPSPSSSASVRRGALAVVTVAARDVRDVRDVQRDAPRDHRNPSTLPANVQELREAWNTLVAAHGFWPWGERTSRQLLEDALAALESRPMEEWRRVFALVPRSPVCRGELQSRTRANVVRVLRGVTSSGHEVADQLLSGAWSVDAEPEVVPPPEEPGASMCLEGIPEGTEAERAWRHVVTSIRGEGRQYAVEWLERARPNNLDEGTLVLECPDRFFLAWVEENYRALLDEHASRTGLAGITLVTLDESTS
ncbi:hypothetical protein FJV41_19825 [Myxococcus llanfairpwllgwyngyllgogerychwyrndrobwllllantysiliogogogochensis]|uniref:DnaA N-terminal domain-containing protein n=1 Tax=Myxococcus llanfairpwllgwyngyllgogerychwyrndrobwllllantysiliogogogochensis TaxID=2590453 RepID=A0A540WZ25_9BACT|nr:DnaA N-terminal domain-containing protein [Myxococcus llanfairpwllgwyngyllgogerychwyrndrobwllllantysiliogogogochensis]TQF14220.1 hypothetical protein FJV41_19825 [Myxococcus llanfairpwllgwyngyllgogerychwyrndrobwllllantysiliogogogochensis]